MYNHGVVCNMNNNNLLAAEKWLNELGIETEIHRNNLGVNRNDVAKVLGGLDSENTVTLIVELKKAVSTKLFWGGVAHNNDWLFLESF